jgi:hypothetical protein
MGGGHGHESGLGDDESHLVRKRAALLHKANHQQLARVCSIPHPPRAAASCDALTTERRYRRRYL